MFLCTFIYTPNSKTLFYGRHDLMQMIDHTKVSYPIQSCPPAKTYIITVFSSKWRVTNNNILIYKQNLKRSYLYIQTKADPGVFKREGIIFLMIADKQDNKSNEKKKRKEKNKGHRSFMMGWRAHSLACVQNLHTK